MNRRPYFWLVLAAALAVGASGCEQAASTGTGSVGKPLIAEPTTGVTFSQDFNPYDTNSVSSSMGTRTLVNEPLVEYDQLDATNAGTHYWLATAYAFQNGGKDLQVTIRQNVKFNDGSAFGPADVAATFKAMENPKADTTGVPPQASDPTVSGNTPAGILIASHRIPPFCIAAFPDDLISIHKVLLSMFLPVMMM